MIVDELVPLIDRTYPTRAELKSRAVAGFSMGGAGAVRLSLLHPKLFCAAASWGGRGRRGEDSWSGPAIENAKSLQANQFALLTVNGDNDHPQAFEPLAATLKSLAIPHETVVLEDTRHSLSQYYERSGFRLAQFLGEQLKRGQADDK